MRIISVAVLFIFIVLLQAGCTIQRPVNWQSTNRLNYTVNYYAPAAEARLKPYFNRAHMEYPPAQIALLAFKQERKLELWAYNGNQWIFIKTYSILAASGGPGPKLHEGDDQVPEGFYHILGLNPVSHFHLSLDLNYPNNFDRAEAKTDHRTQLGGSIFIHGNAVSIGCIAIGDRAIEELFVLVYKTGINNAEVIIAPNDLRRAPPAQCMKPQPHWVGNLYCDLARELANFSTKQKVTL